MEENGGRRYSMSPERLSRVGNLEKAKPNKHKPRLVKPTLRKVQVVYYLSKNGQLEHPHFMEVTHLVNQQLRLKDVMERLTLLRGRGMPSLYSWSCKRSYKNGYVWNDLDENDIICPTDGAEYVLKGSELIQGSAEKLQHHRLGRLQEPMQDPSILHSKRQLLASKRHVELVEVGQNKYEDDEDHNDEEEQETDEYEENLNYTTNTPSRCSRGVSTDEIELLQQTESTHKNPTTTELTLHQDSSPPSTTTSCESNNTSTRFEDGDPVPTESVLSRNSVLLQLIACGGGSVGFNGGKTSGCSSSCVPVVKQQLQPPPCMSVLVAGRKSSSLHKGVLCKTSEVAKEEEVVAVVDELADEISCMSENPRFGSLQAEEKEYFSGSIVESMTVERDQIEPSLKKSSSYNEERSSKGALEAATAAAAADQEEEMKREKAVIGKCMPRKKSSSKQPKK